MKKVETIGSSLVVTDTITGDIEFEELKSIHYYDSQELDLGTVVIKKLLSSKAGELQYVSAVKFPLLEAVDSTDTAFTESTFRTFARDNLGKSDASGGSGAEQILTAFKTADETKVNDNIPALDDDMQVELEANSTYNILVNVYYTAETTPDLKIGWQIPVSAIGEYVFKYELSGEFQSSLATEQAPPGAGVGFVKTGFYTVRIITIDAGTFGLKWSQNTSDAGASTLVKGSSIKALKLN